MQRLRFVFIALGSLVFMSSLVGCSTEPKTNPWGTPSTSRDPRGFVVSPDIFMRVSFLERARPTASGSYLAQNVHFPTINDLRKNLEIRLGHPLQHREEAHLTVLTPPEMEKALLTKLSIDDIHTLARDADIQGFDFEPLCLGRAQKDVDGEPLSTYFIVVRSEAARELRRRVLALFVERGGDASLFSAEGYDPHITVGFVGRDLHQEDSIRKDTSSCWQPLYVDRL